MAIEIPEIEGDHVATLSLYETEEGVQGWLKLGDEEGSLMDVPPHMASQLPMALNMIKAQSR